MIEFGLKSFLTRWIPALILVMATYNPTTFFSYYHWAIQSNPNNAALALKVLAGMVLLIGYGIYVNATLKSMGSIGVIAVVVFFLVLLWVFHTLGWITLDEPNEYAWVALVILATVLAVGMSWAGIWRRLTGQITTDSVEDDAHDH